MSSHRSSKDPGRTPAGAPSPSAGEVWVPCFQELPQELVARLRGGMRVRSHPAGAVLIRQGQRSESLWVVLEGRLKLQRTGPTGRQQTLRLLGPGECFCLAPSHEKISSPVTIECLTPASVVTLGREHLGKLEASPQFARGLIACLTGRLSRAMGDMETAAQLSSAQRVAAVLLDLADRQGVTTERGRMIEGISQEELAACAGTVREVAARALSRLESAGFLERGRGRILVLQPDRLESFLSEPPARGRT